MAEVVDTIVGGTQQPSNFESLPKCASEDKRSGGPGSTTTNQLAETSDCRKRLGGSPPAKVRIYSPLNLTGVCMLGCCEVEVLLLSLS